jgi:hypothetical protein
MPTVKYDVFQLAKLRRISLTAIYLRYAVRTVDTGHITNEQMIARIMSRTETRNARRY